MTDMAPRDQHHASGHVAEPSVSPATESSKTLATPTRPGAESFRRTPSHMSSRPATPTKASPSVTLLNATASSPVLRSRASTFSSATISGHANSAYGSQASLSGTSTPALKEDGVGSGSEPGQGNESTTPSIQSVRKGKEKAGSIVDLQPPDIGGEMVMAGGDARKGLRALVRRSTVGEGGQALPLALSMDQSQNPHVLVAPADSLYSPRRYYVLTNAGKHVFCSHDDDEEKDRIANLMLLISIPSEDDDRIRSIMRGKTRIVFMLRAPLYFFAVSNWGEPEHVLRAHLEYIHLQILSVVSSTQLARAFQRRSNFDLSRLLDGTESFMHSLIDRCQSDFSYLTATLQPLRMLPAARDTAAAALMPPTKFKDLLYVLLIAGGHIVTLLRPRKHSIHPSDLHLLLNTLNSSETLRTSETWLPICFPKFNPAGFVHAYVSYVMEDVGLVFVSADREAFEDLRAWKQIVLEKLENDKTLIKIRDAIPTHPYSISALGCPGLRHFIYKSRQHVQITQPMWDSPYDDDGIDRKRLLTLYQILYDAVHARSGQSSPLRLVYVRTDQEACLAWITKPFELYLAVSPQMSKSAVVAAANTVALWVASEEGKVFLKDAPVF